MALHRFMGMEIGVPQPEALADCYREIGLVGEGADWGTADLADQIRIVEAPYRQLRSMRLGCDSERDLDDLRGRLAGLGVDARRSDGRVICTDPSGSWDISVEVAPPETLTRQPARAANHPGERPRRGARAEVVTEATPRPPRRLAHVVLGSDDPVGAAKFFLEGVGFRMSDQVAGILTFMRCSTDHHNLLVQPAPVPYLNHYAFEFDDIDAIGAAASRYLADHEERHVVGLGRHIIGSNVFWYMNDAQGTMVEFFSDMDDIVDDDAWTPRTDWQLAEFAKWGPLQPPHEFAFPSDLDAIGKAREAERR